VPRYIQKINEDGTSRFVEVGKSDPAATLAIQGDIESFVSPLDGKTVITDRKQLRDHMRKHNVVHASEFSDEFLAKKRAERERLYTGEHTPAEKQRRKEEIHRIIDHLERR